MGMRVTRNLMLHGKNIELKYWEMLTGRSCFINTPYNFWNEHAGALLFKQVAGRFVVRAHIVLYMLISIKDSGDELKWNYEKYEFFKNSIRFSKL